MHERPHREMCEFYADPVSDAKLMLVPRDCWKTSIGAVAYPLWRVLRAWFEEENPAYRVLIDSATCNLSKKIVKSIAAITQTERVNQIFGLVYDYHGDRMEGLSLAFRIGRAPMIREANFTASGIGAEKTGHHCELLILDDLVTRKNKRTVEQREMVKEHFRLMQAIISSDADGRRTEQVVNGTRYLDGDLYGYLLKQDKELVSEGHPPQFTAMIRAAIDKDGELFFPGESGKPGGLPEAVLKKKRETMHADFWAQYMNDPNKQGAPFKIEKLHWTPIQQFPGLYKVRLTIDPAIKEENIQRGDFCAMFAAGWDKWHKPYVLDVSLRRDLTPGGFVMEMLRMARRSAVESILIEDDGSLAGMEVLWRQEMQRTGYSVPVRTIKHNPHEGKESRWVELQEYAERGGIHFNDDIPERYKVEIEDQWSRAPFATNDDVMDALFLQTQLLPLAFTDDVPPTEYARMMGDERTTEEILGEAAKVRGVFRGSLSAHFPDVPSLRGQDPVEEETEDLYEEMEALV